MRRRSRSLAIILALILGLTSLSACKPGATSNIGPEKPTTLTVGATQEPDSLDPMASTWAGGPFVLLYNVYETLVKIDGEGKMHGLLAKEWNLSADRLVYTFKLDPLAKFSSGRQVKAADVVWSIERARTAKGTQKYHQYVSKVEATDEATVTVTLSQPSNSWLYWMSSNAGLVYDSQAGTDWAKATAGSGPYNVKTWSQGQSIELEKNKNYWGKEPRFETVIFRYLTDGTAMNNAMLSGDLDIISNVQAPQSLSQFSDTSRFSIINGTTNGEIVLGLNAANPALAKKEVRQAINYAIDRKALMETIWAGKGLLIGSMVPPTDPWYEDLASAYGYDPAKAKSLLDQAQAAGTKLRLRVPNFPYAVQSAQFSASQLKDVGFDVSVDILEPNVWFDQVYTKGDYDMTIVAHVEAHDLCRYADPQYYWHYTNADVTSLCAAADKGTESEQTDALKKVAKTLSDDAASDWLFLLPHLIVTKSDVSGIPTNLTTTSFDLSMVTVSR
ncbi:MAG: ABC transporter substrate-binding protein [Propionibacteriaceae bacterium]